MSADRISVEVVTGETIVMTEETSSGGLVWQRGLTVDEARAVHRALGVALAQVD